MNNPKDYVQRNTQVKPIINQLKLLCKAIILQVSNLFEKVKLIGLNLVYITYIK